MAHKGETFRDGLVVGAIGYLAVAGLYAGFDLVAARGPVYTVDLLGKSVFRGLRDPAVLGLPMQPDTTAIMMYNGLHLLLSLAIGIVVVALVTQAERRPDLRRAVLATIVAGFIVTIAVVGMLTDPIRPLLPWWSIVVANSLAVVFAGSYLLKKRPGARHLMARKATTAGTAGTAG